MRTTLPSQLKPQIGGGQIDEYWNNLVLGMVGGTIQPAEVPFFDKIRTLSDC